MSLADFKKELANLKEQRLYRTLPPIIKIKGKHIFLAGKKYVQTVSNDYLGLSQNRVLKNTICHYTKKYGCGAGASRLISGNFNFYDRIEQKIAKWKGSQSALIFSSGYLANVGILNALANKPNLSNYSADGFKRVTFFFDKLVHASIIDGVMLATNNMRLSKKDFFNVSWHRFPHNDVQTLKKIFDKNKTHRNIIITESIFSMEGDKAPLSELMDFCYHQTSTVAYLYVDEAHSTGLYGKEGEGLTKSLLQKDDKGILMVMGTFSKAMGLYGAYVCTHHTLRNYFINKARSFIFTTALPPAIFFGIEKAIDIVKNKSAWREQVLHLSQLFRDLCSRKDISLVGGNSQITAVLTKSNQKTLDLVAYLKQNGFYTVGIRYPTVNKGMARVRFTFNRFLQVADIHRLVNLLHQFFNLKS